MGKSDENSDSMEVGVEETVKFVHCEFFAQMSASHKPPFCILLFLATLKAFVPVMTDEKLSVLGESVVDESSFVVALVEEFHGKVEVVDQVNSEVILNLKGVLDYLSTESFAELDSFSKKIDVLVIIGVTNGTIKTLVSSDEELFVDKDLFFEHGDDFLEIEFQQLLPQDLAVGYFFVSQHFYYLLGMRLDFGYLFEAFSVNLGVEFDSVFGKLLVAVHHPIGVHELLIAISAA